MILYHTFIRCFGFPVSLEDKEDNDEIIIKIDSSGSINETTSNNSNRYCINSKIVEILQFLSVTALLGWPIIYSIVVAITNSEFRLFSANIFSIYFFVQYIVGFLYFRNNIDHFKLIILDPKNVYLLNYGLMIGFVLSLLISTAYIVLIIFVGDIGVYSNIFDNKNTVVQVIVLIVTFITIFFSYNVSFINIATFTLTFYEHSHEIISYSKKLHNFIEDVTDGLTTNSIIYEYTDIKTKHSNSVSCLNNILSYATTVGLIGAYFITLNYNSEFKNISNYIDVAWFILLCIIYVYIISKVKDSVDNIKDTVNSSKYIMKYLEKVAMEEYDESGTDDTKHIKDLCIRSMIKIHENSESLLWIILNEKLSSSWANFKVIGFEMDDETLFQKMIAVVIGILMTVQLDTNLF